MRNVASGHGRSVVKKQPLYKGNEDKMSIQIEWDLIKALANVGKYLIEDGTYQDSPDGDITFCVVCGESAGEHAPSCPIPPALKAWHKSQAEARI